MPVNRFFVDSKLDLNAEVVICGDEANHIAKATRRSVGDKISVVNGRGYLADCIILAIDKRSVTVKVDAVEYFKENRVSIVLFQAIPRMNRLDNILEKVTELGCSKIVLFYSEHSEKKVLSDNQKKRANTVVINALKQSGRYHMPKIEFVDHFIKYDDSELKLYGDISPEAPSLSDSLDSKVESVSFFVGPESGFSETEKKLLIKMGVIGVSLNKNILRTDTAAIAATAIIANKFND